jgi:glycosyltransferase involved in cell wall biosynthesis
VRLALIVPGFSESNEDWCVPVLAHLVRELARRHEVEVFALRYPHRRATYRVQGATVHSFSGAATGGVHRLPLYAAVLAHLRRRAKARGFDLIHGLWADEPGFLAVLMGLLLRVPSIVTLMGGELVGFDDIGYGSQLSRANRFLVAASLRRATIVTAGSRSAVEIAQSKMRRLPRELPLGVHLGLFQPAAITSSPLSSGEPRLLHVGSLVPVKEQDLLLVALSAILHSMPRAHLHVVGDGPARPRLARLAASLGVSAHVSFHGAIRHERLPAYYRAADLLVSSSRFESQGMAILEAAACGCPSVATAVGIVPELGRAARPVPVGDPAALATAVIEMSEDTSQRAAMGQDALRLVHERYSIESTVTQLEALYSLGVR